MMTDSSERAGTVSDTGKYQSLIDSSVINIIWSFVAFFSTKALNLITVVILARLLSPSDFGLMAFCLLIIAYFEILARFGLGTALVSERIDEDAAADSVFWIALVLSSAMAAALFFGSDMLAAYFEAPTLAPMLQLTCVGVVIEAVAIVHNSLLTRHLRFKKKVIPEVTRGLVKGIVAISLAFMGFGIWSLVYAYVAGVSAFAITLFIVNPWRPRALPKRAPTGRMLRFGSHLIAAELIGGFVKSFPPLLVGKVLGPASLGLYTVASRIPELCIKNFSFVAGSVTHPIMADIRQEPETLRAYVRGCLRYMSILIFPGSMILAAVSGPIVQVLYTPEWYEMIATMQWLSLAFAIATLNMLPGSVYKAINRPQLIVQVSLFTAPVRCGALWLAAPYGIEAVAISQAGISAALILPHVIMLQRIVGVAAMDWISAMLPGFGCAVAVAVVGFALDHALALAPMLELIVIGTACGLAYLGTLRMLAPEVYREAIRLGLRKLGRIAATGW